MSDFGPNSTQEPAQVIEKPTSVTVFGVLNIVFGIVSLLYGTYFLYKNALMTVRPSEITLAQGLWILFLFAFDIGFSIWVLTLGIGLLKLKKWARRGTVIFAFVYIALLLSGETMSFVSMSETTIPENKLPEVMADILGHYLNGLIYPILLIVFMQTAKVKRAFGAIGG